MQTSLLILNDTHFKVDYNYRRFFTKNEEVLRSTRSTPKQDNQTNENNLHPLASTYLMYNQVDWLKLALYFFFPPKKLLCLYS